MNGSSKIREIVRSILNEDFITPFSALNDTELLDTVGLDSIAFIGRDPKIYSWFESNRIQLIGGTQIWVKQNDYEVKGYIRKLLGLL